jgi:hypothetical protein
VTIAPGPGELCAGFFESVAGGFRESGRIFADPGERVALERPPHARDRRALLELVARRIFICTC